MRFLDHDITAARDARLDLKAIGDSSVRIIPAAGTRTPHHVFDRQRAEQLATLRGTQLTSFPGGHNGNLTHPAGYADIVRALL